MTLDELKELKRYVMKLYDDNLIGVSARVNLCLMIAKRIEEMTANKIDSEIAIQQAPDDVQAAIDWVRGELSTSEIYRDGDFGIPIRKSHELENIRNTILHALQSSQPKPVPEPCEYCNGEKPLTDKVYSDGTKFDDRQGTRIEWMGSQAMLVSYIREQYFDWPVFKNIDKSIWADRWAVPIAYCPSCGRELRHASALLPGGGET
jgi:hypothetical protein